MQWWRKSDTAERENSVEFNGWLPTIWRNDGKFHSSTSRFGGVVCCCMRVCWTFHSLPAKWANVQYFYFKPAIRRAHTGVEWEREEPRWNAISSFRLSLCREGYESQDKTFLWQPRRGEGERSPSYIGCDIKHSFLLPFYTIESRNHFFHIKMCVCSSPTLLTLG